VYECRIKGDAHAFRTELETVGCRCSDGEDGVIKILMNGDLSSHVLLQAARSCHVQIRHLVPLRHSLEEVFLEAISERKN
jgi:hypothetical protein